MGCLIALGVLALIAMIPIGVSAFYDEDGPRAYVIAGFIRIPIFPIKKKEKKEKAKKTKEKTKAKTAEKSAAKKAQTRKKKKGGSIDDFLPVLDAVLDFVLAFGRKLRINVLELKIILGGGDPCDLALNYGRGWAVLGNLMPQLEKAFTIQKRNLEVECDFLAEKTTVLARLDLTITIGRIFSLLLVRGVPVLRELLKLMKIIKGGAKA